MSKQDRQGVRTATDLERKYNLSSLSNQASENARQDSQINQLGTAINSLSRRVSELEGSSGSELEERVSALEQSDAEIDNRLTALEQSDQETYGFLVTVQTESLDTESITADKSFAEIEEAILAGQNVRIKLVCESEDSVLYLRLTSHQEGIEANFCGYYNGIPIVLQLLA